MSDQKFHLMGQSLGGYISGMYACRYPDDLKSVGLFCPSGVIHKALSESIEKAKSTGSSPVLLPTNMEEMKISMESFTYKRAPYIPDILQRGMLHLKLEKQGFFLKRMFG